MDAVILAAGRNRRLTDWIGEFQKPLIRRINELSLVHNAVHLARLQGIERPVVVVSPSNALEIHSELRTETVDMVIQREPNGPGDALRLGLALSVSEPFHRVLVLLADNTLTINDVNAVTMLNDTAIGCRRMTLDDAERFTWYDPDERRWREKERVPNRLAHGVDCWVGPFVGYRHTMQHVLRYALPINGEYAIGPHLDDLTSFGARVPVSSVDVGTTEAYLSYVRGELP